MSLAWAFAPTEAERAIIAQAHRDAVDAAMCHVESELGRARKGKAGRDGFEPGRIGWIRFDHYASRPTVEVPRRDAATGEAYTELVTLKVAGDPQLHTHVAVPNAVLTESGRVGGLDLQRLEGRVHEWGALYQAHLATNLRRHGIEVALDGATGAARITAISERVRAAFSKRTMNGTDAARAYAAGLGLDWDKLDADRRIGLAKRGVQGDPRQAKQDDLSDWAAWRREAAALGWQHRSVLRPEAIPLPAREARLEQAYQAALGLLDRDLQRRAVTDASVARVAAARGLIASGVESAAEIDDVVRAFAKRGVRQDGQAVGLIWGLTADAQGREWVRLTTTLHVERETEFVALAQAAAADKSGALSRAAIAAAVARSGRDFSESAHGRTQLALIDRLGQGGRLAVAIGVAGSGKSTVLAPLVDAWQREGRRVYGAALAWRQSDDLAGAGIAESDRAAFSVFLDRVAKGQVRLDRSSVVVVDELGLLGTRQLLELLRVQAATGCQVVAVGDPKQCQAIEAGPVIELLRRALGAEAVPELLTTVRQQSARERETSLMFREGRAAEALALKRADGTAQLVPGGYREAVAHVADLWAARRAANAHDPDYTLTVSAPSNADARAIGAAIRERRRDAGELGPDQVVLDACDQNGAAYCIAACGRRPGAAVRAHQRRLCRPQPRHHRQQRFGAHGARRQRCRRHVAERAGPRGPGEVGHAARPAERAHPAQLRRRTDDRRHAGADQHRAHPGDAGRHAGGHRLQGVHRGEPAPAGELSGYLGRGGAAGDRGTPAARGSAADPGGGCVDQHGAQPRPSARDARGAGFPGAGASGAAQRRALLAGGAAARRAAPGRGAGEDHAGAHLAAAARGRASGGDDGAVGQPGAGARHGAGGTGQVRSGGPRGRVTCAGRHAAGVADSRWTSAREAAATGGRAAARGGGRTYPPAVARAWPRDVGRSDRETVHFGHLGAGPYHHQGGAATSTATTAAASTVHSSRLGLVLLIRRNRVGGRGGSFNGVHPTIVLAQTRARSLSAMPGNRRRTSIAAANSPPRSNAARIAAASSSETTNIRQAWKRSPPRASKSSIAERIGR